MARLELIIGCMFSGKTTELIRRIRRYQSLDKKLLLITHVIDKRYTSGSMISTHNREMIPAVSLNLLRVCMNREEYKESGVIFIEEAQFFSDLYDCVMDMVNKDDKTVIVCGLDGDFQLNPFEQVLRLIPHSERVQKFNALCRECRDGTEACFSKRITPSSERELIGGKDIYKAVCRYHYYMCDEQLMV